MDTTVNVSQIVYEGFLAGAINALTSADDVREACELPDEVEDGEIEAAMKSAVKACNYPFGTVVLTIDEAVRYGKRESLSGVIWAAIDVDAEATLSESVLSDLAEELGRIDDREVDLRFRDVHPDDTDIDAAVYTAFLLPRLRDGYGDYDRTDRGKVLGKVHVINAVRETV